MINSQVLWNKAQDAELKMITTNTPECLVGWHKSCLNKIGLSFGSSECILDVCSGPISMLEFIPPCNRKVAVDALAHKYAEKYIHHTDVEYMTMMAESLNFEDGSFDKVFCFNAIDHCVDYKKVLRELFRVVKPGGRIILSFENMNYMYKLFYGLGFKKLCQIYHPSEISYSDVKKTVKSINDKCRFYCITLYEKITIRNILKHVDKSNVEVKEITAQYTLPVIDRAVHYFILIWNRLFSFIFRQNHAYFVVMIIDTYSKVNIVP
jgi:ubiquinone/menaquinone biosynthesis C-methylase UbiE